MRGARATAIAAALAMCALTLGAVGSQDPAQQPPRFRTGVDVIQLDVTVLDARRRPVRGLTAADFTVLEDGKPQPIVGFAEVVVPEPETPPAAWMREIPPDVRTNDLPTEGRLIVIVMDDSLVPPDPTIVANAKQIGRKVVDSMGPHDLAAVVFTLNNRNAQDFTADRSRLLRAIDGFSSGFAFMRHVGPGTASAPVFADEDLFRRYSIDTLSRAAEYLRAIPQRRKTVIYVSTGIPVDLETAATPVNIGAEGVRASPTLSHQDLIRSMQNAFGHALTANVNIYGIDPGGLGGIENFLMSRGVDMQTAQRQALLRLDYLQAVSENSGGRAVVNTNSYDDAIADVFVENSSYYLVGYQTPKPQQDGSFRRLEVRVNRPGATVHSRNGYYAARAPKPRKPNEPEPSPLVTAMAGFLPKGDVPMQAAAVPFAIAGKKDAAVVIVARLQHPPVEKRTVQQVELITSAFDPLGKPKQSHRQTARVVLLPTDAAEVHYEVLSRIDLKPGQYHLRIASHNPALDKSGSVYADVDVPDFSKDGLWLSGMVLAATPGIPAAPRDALAGVLPVIPTTIRSFQKDDDAVAFLQVYQRGKAADTVAMSARVVDQKGTIVDRADGTLAPDRFSKDGGAEYRFSLPLSILSPGPHLLTVEAKAGGKTSRRDIRFVRK